MTTETLTYRSIARKGVNHIDDGVIYVAAWETGHQQLVFPSHAKARAWAKANNQEYRGPGKDHTP